MNEIQKISLTRDIIIISGIFCAFTAILLLINYMQMTGNEPLESEALKTMVERLASDSGNEALKEDIRNLDLLARKAYFTAQWQVKTGAWLLLVGSLIFAAAIWFNSKLRSKIEKPVLPEQAELPARLNTRRWLLLTGGILFALALVASFLSNDYLKNYQPQLVEEVTQAREQVQVVGISREESSAEDASPDTPTDEETRAESSVTSPASAPGLPEKKAQVKLTAEELFKQHNSFRGAFGHGISGRKNIPVDWNGAEGKNVLWKTAVPLHGYNSPVIWDDLIFISGADNTSRVVYCFDRNSGKLIWEAEASGIPGSPPKPPDVTEDTGLAAPTLTVDGNAVYAIFGTGDLIAFDLEGKRLWSRNLGAPDNHYGHSSSLIVWDNKLIVQYDTNRGGRLLAINTANGESVWDVRRTSRISWASPILIPVNGKYQIVTSAEPTVAAHDLASGDVIWSLDCMMGEIGPSPAYSEGLVFVTNEYASLVAIQPGDEPVILWEDNEYLPEAASPVVYNGLLYLATSYGLIACYDMMTGEKQWDYDAANGFYSSPVVADGKVYVIDMGGTMYVFKAGREKTLLGKPVLGERAYATPAFTDGRIYLRGDKSLFCIGVK